NRFYEAQPSLLTESCSSSQSHPRAKRLSPPTRNHRHHRRRYNEKADVHSFAVVLWELVTGWLPYAGLSPELFMFQAVQVCDAPPPRLL
ncbi:unnamed protein product, partial [Hapterophycus canaliculatus]